MTGLRIAKGVELDPDVAGGWTFGLLAKKGAGKTYGARVMAEEMLAAGIPIVALDPTGAWWGLRAGAGGTKTGGLQVVIFGGDHGDVPLEPTAGKLMADLAVEQRVPMVLDMSGFGTRAAERKFAKEFLDHLYRQNKTLMHLFVDEADLFAPQKPQPGDLPLLGMMENLVRRGRIKGIGCTLITQRPAVLNKDVLTQCDVLVLLRTTGPQDRDAVKKWVDGHGDSEMAKGVFDTLAGLQNGEAWFWAPEIGLFKRAQIRRSRTFDSSPTPTRGGETAAPASLAEVDLEAVREAMAETIERAAEEDPALLRARIAQLEGAGARQYEAEMAVTGLRARIADLEAQLAAVPPPEVVTEVVTVQVPAFTKDMHAKILTEIDDVLHRHRTPDNGLVSVPVEEWSIKGEGGMHLPSDEWRGKVVLKPEVPPSLRMTIGLKPLKAGARRMLEAIASLDPVPLTRAQVGTLAKVKSSGGTYSSYLSALKVGGYVADEGGKLSMTERGWQEIGGKPPAPATAGELRDLWRSRLKGGAVRMLDYLIGVYPQSVSRAELGEFVEIAASGGTFASYLSSLRSAGLIEVNGTSLKAAPILFTGPRS